MSDQTSFIAKAKDGLIEAIKGVGDVTNATLETVSGSLVTALKGTKDIGSEAGDLITFCQSGIVENRLYKIV